MTTAAFFDVDGTIFRGLTMASLVHHILDELGDPGLVSRLLQLERDAASYPDRQVLTEDFFRLLAGRSWSQMVAWGRSWYERDGRANLIPEVIERLHEHRERGEMIVLVSGSWLPCLLPIARDLAADHIYCCQADVEADTLTGDVSIVPIDETKAAIVREFSSSHGVNLTNSYAYGDDDADTPMLATVGHAVAVSPSAGLAETAQARGWEILRPGPPRATHILA